MGMNGLGNFNSLNDFIKNSLMKRQQEPGLVAGAVNAVPAQPTGYSGKTIIGKGPAMAPPGGIPTGLGKIPQGLNPLNTGGPSTSFGSINDLARMLGIGGMGTSYGVNAMNNIGPDLTGDPSRSNYGF